MWHINAVTTPNDQHFTIFGGLPGQEKAVALGDRLGPEGSSYTICIANFGCIMLKDIGQGGYPYGTWAVQVNMSSVNWLYTGEGQVDISVDANGKLTMTGGSGAVSANIMAMTEDCNAMMSDPGGYSFSVLGSDEGSTRQIQVSNAATLVVAMVNSIGLTAQAGAAMVVTDPNGQQYSASTPASGNVTTVNGPDGLVFLRVNNPVAGTWTATGSNSQALPFYLYTTTTATANNIQSATNAYNAASQSTKNDLSRLGLFMVGPSGSEGTVLARSMEWPSLSCQVCQASWYVCLGALAMLAPEIALVGTIGGVALDKLVKVVSNILNLDTGTAANVLNVISILLDPLDWPKAICKLTGMC